MTKMRTPEGTRLHNERLQIGKRIAANLEEKMTQKEVAEHFGVSPTAIAHAERMALWKVAERMKKLGITLEA